MTGSKINILLIEDNREYVLLLRQMLLPIEDAWFEVIVAETLREGVVRLREGGIDVVLLDLTLPDSCGFETFSGVYGESPQTPIIVLSGVADESLAVQTVQEGAQDYLVKGHGDQHTLLRAIRYAIERKRIQLDLEQAHRDLERRVEERTGELFNINKKLKKEVAERKRIEEALRDSNHRLAEALEKLRETQEHIIQRERLHALGRMASGIAHDFNNSLAPIMGFSELLLLRPENLTDRKKVKDYVEMIHDAAEDSAKVVARLREFYRRRDETEVFSPVSLNDVIQQVVSLTQPKWRDQALVNGNNIRIKTDLQSIPAICGNGAELREMFTNLIFNAIDAITKDGVITFRTFVADGMAVAEVSDNGIGMTDEVRARCLEPFFSTKAEHGTGLGLGIVYGIVRRHDGSINIVSAPGKGTTLRITLPLYKEPIVPESPQVPQEALDHSLSILAVEDDPMVREIIEAYLKEDKHRVELAINGRDGLERFKSGAFDLVITDRAMPEMNGDQLASEIKKLMPEMPVILLTGFGDLMTSSGESPAGVDLIVNKPFTLKALRNAIVKGIGR